MPTFADASLSEIIAEYRAQLASHSTALASHDDDRQLVDATYGPSLDALETPPAVRSHFDAMAALELALEDTDFTSSRDEALVRSTLAWLRADIASREDRCICIDDDWTDDRGSPADGPKVGEVCAIESVRASDESTYIKIRGHDGFFELCAFRLAN